MLPRVIVGFLLVPLLLLVLFVAPDWVLLVFISLISLLAVQELLGTTGYIRHKRVMAYAVIFAAAIPPWYFFDTAGWLPVAGLFFLVLILFIEGFWGNVNYENISVVITTSIILPFFFSSLIRIVGTPLGKHLIILPFIAASVSDTFAYFVGKLLGKHKLAPNISPNKTLEGSIGGIVATILVMLGYGLVMRFSFDKSVNYFLLAIYGVSGSIVAQIGDLSMSLIKREFHIKDFGSLLPGHGGILDRLDSLMFTAPFIELLILFIPAVY